MMMSLQKGYAVSPNEIRRSGMSGLLAVVLITLAGYGNGLGQSDEDPYASFKENGVESDCVVPRLDASPAYGNDYVYTIVCR
jgi:hypothetical protein